MRKLLLLFLILLMPAGFILALEYARTDLSELPPLESGDLIFETAGSSSALAIMVASGSLYTHVGVVHKQADGSVTVVNASRHVVASPLAEFVTFSLGQRITVMRYPNLTDAQRASIVSKAESYLGMPYNYVFYMQNPKEVYCSEIPYFAYAAAQAPIGKITPIGDLYVNNRPVHKLFDARWRMHPACQKQDMTAQTCWETVMKEPIITPASLAHDPHLVTIYNNYHF